MAERFFMPVATAIAGIGGSIVNGFLGSNAASNAASAETTAANAAIAQNTQARNAAQATQQSVYQQDEQNEAPYQAAGTTAVNQMNGAVLNGQPNAQQVLAQDPGYQFRLDQANLALQRMQAASGGVGSGGALKAAAQYSQNLASSEYGNAYNRVLQSNAQRFGQLNALAGIGANANQQQLYAGANYANQSGAYGMDTSRLNSDLLTQIGNAQAAGTVGQANAFEGMTSGISQGATGLLPSSSGYVNGGGTAPMTMPGMPYMGNLQGLAYSQAPAADVGQFGALPTAPPYQPAPEQPLAF